MTKRISTTKKMEQVMLNLLKKGVKVELVKPRELIFTPMINPSK